MLAKRIFASSAFPARIQLGAVLLMLLPLILVPVAHGLSSPCPTIFQYRRDLNTNQVFGYIELPNLRIGQAVKLNVDLSIGAAVPENNVGSITLVKSKEHTFRDIYNKQPAQYRVNFPFRNVFPSLLEIRVNGQPICYGPKATGQIVTTINLDHTLVTQLQTLSNDNGNNVYAIPTQRVQQSPSPIVYTPTAQRLPEQAQFVNEPEAVQTPRPRPQPKNVCGEPAPKFSKLSFNGQHSPKGQFPWAVPVFVEQGSVKKPRYICGSTIISKYHLVTAAHCMFDGNRELQPSDLLVTPGMYNIDDFFENDIQDRDVASIIVHPDYYIDDGVNDIALMVLQQAIVYNDLVRPICLWIWNDKLENIVGKTALVSGWGLTERGPAETPSYVHAKVVSNNQCRRHNGAPVEIGTFCANGQGQVPCSGDSGSGLAFKQGSQFYIRGVVSKGQFDLATFTCDTSKYVVYTDIASYRTWLLQEMNV